MKYDTEFPNETTKQFPVETPRVDKCLESGARIIDDERPLGSGGLSKYIELTPHPLEQVHGGARMRVVNRREQTNERDIPVCVLLVNSGHEAQKADLDEPVEIEFGVLLRGFEIIAFADE